MVETKPTNLCARYILYKHYANCKLEFFIIGMRVSMGLFTFILQFHQGKLSYIIKIKFNELCMVLFSYGGFDM